MNRNVKGLSEETKLRILKNAFVDATISGGKLILRRFDGTGENAGSIAGGGLTPAETDAAMAPVLSDPESASAQALSAAIAGLSFGKASGGDDTAAMQAVLDSTASFAKNARIRGVPGEDYKISAALVLKSGQTLDMTGCTVTLTDGSQTTMLTNPAATTSAATGTGSVTAGANTLTTALASSAVVGQSVYVAGAANSATGGPDVLCARVGTIDTTAGTVTLVDPLGNAVNADVTVSGAAVTLYNRDSNITVNGGTWNRGNNGWKSATPGPGLCGTNFKRIDGLAVRDAKFTAASNAGYLFHAGDLFRFRIEGLSFDAYSMTANGDGVHINGPAAHGTVRNITGTTHDDFVSLCCTDNQTNLDDTSGAITGVLIENLQATKSPESGVKLRAGGTFQMRRVTVRTVRGVVGQEGVNIQAADYHGNDVADVLVEDVAVTGKGAVNVYSSATKGTITLKNIATQGTVASTSDVYIYPQTTLGCLIIDGCTLGAVSGQGIQIGGQISQLIARNVVSMDGGRGSAAYINAQSGCNITTLSVLGLRAYKNAGVTDSIITITGTVGTLHVQDAYVNGGGRLATTTSTAPALVALFDNVTLDGADRLASLPTTADVVVNNLNVKSISGSGIIILGSSTVLSVRGQGLLNPGNKAGFQASATTPPRVVHPDWRCDLSTIAKNDGDTAYNTNGALACGTGRAISNGTNWKNLYSGATY